jgi:GMP synthase-like glutamine amidotransferase
VKIGLLECDHVSENLRHIAGDYRDMFGALFARHAPQIELTCFDVRAGVLPDSVDACEGYLTTGSRFSAYDDEPWINHLKTFVRDLHASETPLWESVLVIRFSPKPLAVKLTSRLGNRCPLDGHY